MKKQAKKKTVTLYLAETQGAAAMCAAMEPPKGYEFESMDRKRTKVVVTYCLVETQ